MRVAFLLLAHEKPSQLQWIFDSAYYRHPDVRLYIHYDLNAGLARFEQLKQMTAHHPNVVILQDRITCRWATYSLVDATRLMMVAALADASFKPDYLYLISGSCAPIRPFPSLQEFLRQRQGMQFLQATNIEEKSWVRGGLEKERYELFHPFDYKTQKSLFDRCTQLQRALKIKRRIPPGYVIHFGSQWLCITRDAAEAVVKELAQPKIARFFRLSWIPDEFAIQTIVASRYPASHIADYTLTYGEFGTEGRPIIFYNDHLEHLRKQPFFFARKISHHAQQLRTSLAELWETTELDLRYFREVGNATTDIQNHLFIAKISPIGRSKVGTITDPWRGLIDRNTKPYLIFAGLDRARIGKITRYLRESYSLPIFDFVFDPGKLIPAAERLKLMGVGRADTHRRDYDQLGFLCELLFAAQQPIGFALDPAFPSHVRDLVRWDPNAVILLCDSSKLAREDKVSSLLERKWPAKEAYELEKNLSAALLKQPLPADFFIESLRAGEHTCRIIDTRIGISNDIPYSQQIQSALRHIGDDPSMKPNTAQLGKLFSAKVAS